MQKEMHDVSINNPNRLTDATASQLEFKDYYLFLLFCSATKLQLESLCILPEEPTICTTKFSIILFH